MFGGYWGYLAAPLRKAQQQILVVQARHEAEAEINADYESEFESQQERYRR